MKDEKKYWLDKAVEELGNALLRVEAADAARQEAAEISKQADERLHRARVALDALVLPKKSGA